MEKSCCLIGCYLLSSRRGTRCDGCGVWAGVVGVVCGLECGKGVACAVLGRGVVLSKQIGIKQGDSECHPNRGFGV